MVTTLNPNANDTPTSPMPTCGNAAAITALPQPAKVSQNVPIASAAHFLEFMTFLLLLGAKTRARRAKGHRRL
jgi:cell division septation protein DedD